MKIRPEELTENGYVLLDKLGHQELVPFIRTYIRKKTKFSPFLVVTTTLTILLFVVNPAWTLTIAGILLTHTAMCSGDFAILSYFEFHKDKQVVTFDDKENGVSYFYGLVL